MSCSHCGAPREGARCAYCGSRLAGETDWDSVIGESIARAQMWQSQLRHMWAEQCVMPRSSEPAEVWLGDDAEEYDSGVPAVLCAVFLLGLVTLCLQVWWQSGGPG